MLLEKVLILLIGAILLAVGSYEWGVRRGEKRVHNQLDPVITAFEAVGKVQTATSTQKEDEDMDRLRRANEGYQKELRRIRNAPVRSVRICPTPNPGGGEVPGVSANAEVPGEPSPGGVVPAAVGEDIGRQAHDLLVACEATAAAAREASAAWPRRRSN